MKKLSVIILISVLPLAVKGQMLLGVKGGFNLSKINYSPWFDQFYAKFDYKKGYSGGLIFQYFSEKKLGIQAEILYTEKGFITHYDTINNNQYERKINYITLPLLMHFYFLQKKTTPYLLLGVFSSMALNSQEIYTDDHKITKTVDYQFTRKRDNRGEYGLDGGFGIKRIFPFGTLQAEGEFVFSFDSIYKWGTRSLNTDLNRYFEIPEEAQNQVITISVSYLFPLKKKTFNLKTD